jgi:hypothetical protein
VFEMTVLSIFRQSASYLPRYFSQIEKAFALRKGPCHAVWLEGDSGDATFDMLQSEKKKLEILGHQVTLFKFDLKGPLWSSKKDHRDRWLQLATCWNRCMEGLLPSKITVCVESDLIWDPLVIDQMLLKLDASHHVVCPMLMAEGSLELFGFERFYDTWGFSRSGKKFFPYPPYWLAHEKLKEEEELLEVSTGGGMLISTYEHQKKGKWALDCCIMHYPEEVRVFMDKTIHIHHPMPDDWKNLSVPMILAKKIKYRLHKLWRKK